MSLGTQQSLLVLHSSIICLIFFCVFFGSGQIWFLKEEELVILQQLPTTLSTKTTSPATVEANRRRSGGAIAVARAARIDASRNGRRGQRHRGRLRAPLMHIEVAILLRNASNIGVRLQACQRGKPCFTHCGGSENLPQDHDET